MFRILVYSHLYLTFLLHFQLSVFIKKFEVMTFEYYQSLWISIEILRFCFEIEEKTYFNLINEKYWNLL